MLRTVLLGTIAAALLANVAVTATVHPTVNVPAAQPQIHVVVPADALQRLDSDLVTCMHALRQAVQGSTIVIGC